MSEQKFFFPEEKLRILWKQDIEKILPEAEEKDRTAYLIAQSGLFDTEWYISQYPDVALSDIDPLLHYVRFGYKENRNPTPWFQTKFYLDKNIDVKEKDINPFLHYIYQGSFEGRMPHKNKSKN